MDGYIIYLNFTTLISITKSSNIYGKQKILFTNSVHFDCTYGGIYPNRFGLGLEGYL